MCFGADMFQHYTGCNTLLIQDADVEFCLVSSRREQALALDRRIQRILLCSLLLNEHVKDLSSIFCKSSKAEVIIKLLSDKLESLLLIWRELQTQQSLRSSVSCIMTLEQVTTC